MACNSLFRRLAQRPSTSTRHLASVQNEYLAELSKVRESEEEFGRNEALRQWARNFADLGNFINRVPFTEFTEEGYEVSADPAQLLALIRLKDMSRGIESFESGETIRRRTFKPWVGHVGQLRKTTDLLHAGVKADAWIRALDDLNTGDKALAQQLTRASQEASTFVRGGRTQEAYELVKRWRGNQRYSPPTRYG